MEAQTPASFPSIDELDARLAAGPPDPIGVGRVELLVLRPERGVRLTPAAVELRRDLGVVGDGWLARGSKATPDGSADPRAQVALMNARVLACLTEDRERWPLAGDQLVVDLDLSVEALPVGTRLAAGTAVIEITELPHTGCDRFRDRFGVPAVRWVNSPEGMRRRLRGVLARVVADGRVTVGDTIRIVAG